MALHALFAERIRTAEDATACSSEQALEAAIPTLKDDFRAVYALNCPTPAPTSPPLDVVAIVGSVIGGLSLVGGIYAFVTGKIAQCLKYKSSRLGAEVSSDDNS